MKKILLYTVAALGLTSLTTSCSNFGDTNIDPENMNPANMDYTYMFTHVQSQIAGSDWDQWRTGCIYSANMVQHTTSVDWAEGVFYTWSGSFNAAFWDGFYSGERGAVRNVVEVMERWKNKPEYANEYQYARVMKAYILQRMTDLYGDVPYFEAGRKAFGGSSTPKYDTQEVIYDDLLKELDEVNTALKATTQKGTIGAADVIYAANPEPWRKFANSLMLRVAMRLTKVDPAKAAVWAKKAVANGVFTSAEESAIVMHNDGTPSTDSAEPFGKIVSDSDPQAFYLSEFFINALKGKADPRIHMIATKCAFPASKFSEANKFDLGDNSDASQLIGLPMGYELKAGDWDLSKAPGYPGEKEWRSHYALINRKTISRPDAPSMLVTYAETCLLLADAAERGFINGGNAAAKDYFEKGIRAAMSQFSLYKMATSDYQKYLAADKVNAYVTARLADFNANALSAINWEYYVVTLGDEYETFANWRRSGYPELKSVYSAPYNRPKYPNSISTEIPRRFTYPVNESQNNAANYNEAVKRLSNGDKMDSRVWWDVVK